MFCKYCGNELTEEARFCPKCGKISENKPEEIDYFYDLNAAEPATQEDVANVENPERDSRGGEILKFAILGFADEISDNIEDLPTFGKPIRPTSASILSSRITSRSSPLVPDFANLGICLVGVAK